MKHYLSLFLILLSFSVQAQISLSGIISQNQQVLPGALIYIPGSSFQASSDANGYYRLRGIPAGKHELVVFYTGNQTLHKTINLDENSGEVTMDFSMEEINAELDDITVRDQQLNQMSIERLKAVEGTNIYEAKKTEVINLQEISANLATNNSRQVYAKIPGLNIYESDAAGLQLGIGARGLDPNRTSNFNVRQNGYDISADALGYPESYYTPALEAVERIEVVRGAASLQYGTQFGGLLNFQMKSGHPDKEIDVRLRNTAGSYGFYNTFTSLGGSSGKWNYYGFFQYKRGDGWRENSQFNSIMAYAAVKYQANEKLSIGLQYTYMKYLAQQPGGLTDAMFYQDPRQSIRDRNWFQVNWNLIANTIDYRFSDRLKLNIRNFALIGGRDALGNLGRIDRVDDMGPRNLFVDDFSNFGSESRLMYHYQINNQPQVALIGFRYYNGLTDRKQGLGDDGSDANFSFTNPDHLEDSDYDFPGKNLSFFAEHIFNLNPRFSVTPGMRIEHILTEADGYYSQTTKVLDPDTGFAVDSTYQVQEYKSNSRTFAFAGIGLSYKPNEFLEVYSNFSQNYRSINFNDIRVNNPNLVVDENIKDESGYNFDLGFRGSGSPNKYNFDLSFFYLRYNDRIGAILQVDPENFRIYRYRTNIADAYSMGLEAFGEVNLKETFIKSLPIDVNVFANFSVINAKYLKSSERSVEGNQVELVPPFSLRPGLTLGKDHWKLTYQYAYVQEHYTDASNAVQTATAVEGIIPSYSVMDISAFYRWKRYKVEGSINNLTNNMYFTRRAAGYPGPGIIPSDGRSFFLTLEINI